LPVVPFNTVLVDYALSFAFFLHPGNMRRGSFASHLLPILILTITILLRSFVFVPLVLLNSAFGVKKRLAAVRAVALGMPNFAAVCYRCFTPYMANTKPAPLHERQACPNKMQTWAIFMPAVHWDPRDAAFYLQPT
jgi:hypothetical protein